MHILKEQIQIRTRGYISMDPTNQESKIFWKNSRKFQKAKLEFTIHWELFTQHLYCLGIIRNLEMI